MQSYFAQMEPWSHNDGALHLYVLPSEEEVDRVAPTMERWVDVEGLPPMPLPYLHLTLQKLAHFDDELTQPQLSRLGISLSEVLGAVPAFDVDLAAPRVADTSITCEGASSPAWNDLVTAVRAGVVAALGDEPALPAPPHGPHLTLSYATAEVDDAVVEARLDGVAVPQTVRVDTVHLVSVTVRPERGIFDFTHLASWDLA